MKGINVMITKNDLNDKKTQVQMISLDQLVPEDHILRKIDRYIDFTFIYDLVEDKYSTETGRPSIDPVVLIKIAIIQFMFEMLLIVGFWVWISMIKFLTSAHSVKITKEDLKGLIFLNKSL